MNHLSDANAIIDTICQKSGASPEEVRAAVDAKQKKFAGMLTGAGAAFLAAKDLGVDLEMDRYSEKYAIAQLAEGMQNVDIQARIAQVFAPRTYDKNGRAGQMVSLILADDTGEIRLTLWNRAAQSFLDGDIGRGDLVLARNCVVRTFREQKQLESGFEGALDLVHRQEDAGRKFADILEGESGVDLVARVSRVFPPRAFSANGREGQLQAVELSDGKSHMRAVAWNDAAAMVAKLEPNDVVRVENAYTKKSQSELELHLGYAGRIRKTSQPSEIPLLKEAVTQRMRFDEAGEGLFENRALVAAVLESVLVFEACPSCGKKVQEFDGKKVCAKCGQVDAPQPRLVLSLELDDGFARVPATLFGAHAEQVLGKSAQEVTAMLAIKDKSEVFEALAHAAVGREIVASGARTLRGGAPEMRVAAARVADPRRETARLLEKE